MRYQAFISYSHAADGKLVPRLQSAMQSFAKPWYRLRAIRIFRDKTSLAANPALWHSVTQAIDESEYFILLASPVAAKSRWVRKELKHWLSHKAADKILIGITAGEFVWDECNDDIDWMRTDAVPKELAGAFMEEPLYVDLRAFDSKERLSLSDPEFRDKVADLVAPLHGKSKEDIAGQEVREHRRLIAIIWSVISVLTVLCVTAVWYAFQAERQRHIAVARKLAAQSELILQDSVRLTERSVLLATESLKRLWSPEADRALRRGLALLPRFIGTFQQPRGVDMLAFSPDDKWLASAGHWWLSTSLEPARLWDMRSFTERAVLMQPGGVSCVEFSPSGRYLATAGGVLDRGGIITLWALPNAEQLWQSSFAAEVENIRFNQNGKMLAASVKDAIYLLDAENGDTMRVLSQKKISKVAFTSDGKQLIALSGLKDLMNLWDVATGTLIGQRNLADYAAPEYLSEDGTFLASATGDEDDLRVLRISSLSQVMFKELEEIALDVTLSRNGTRVSAGGYDYAARVWEIERGREIARVGHDEAVNAIALSSDGRKLAVGGERDGWINVWELPLDNQIANWSGVNRFFPRGFSSNGKILIMDFGSRVKLLEAQTGHELCTIEVGVGDKVAVSDKGHLIVTSLYRTAKVWEVNTGRLLNSFQHERGIVDLSLSADGKTLAIAYGDFPIRRMGMSLKTHICIWDTESGRMHCQIVFPEKITAIVISTDGQLIAVVGEKGLFGIWETTSGTVISRFSADIELGAVALSSDGSLCAIGGIDGNARVIDVQRRRELFRFKHEGEVFALDFSPDGRFIVVGTDNGILKIWDLNSGAEVCQTSQRGDIFDLTFCEVGQYVTTLSNDGNARVWTWRPEDLIAEACSRVTRNLSKTEWKLYIGEEAYHPTCEQLIGQ